MPGIFEEQFDAAVQAKLNVSGGGGPVETRAVDSAIAAADNGKILYVAGGGTVTLTFDAGLPEGFEVGVIADANSAVTIQPASGQKMVTSSSPPIYLPVDDPVVSPKLGVGGSTTEIGVGRWKLVGTGWVQTSPGGGWAGPVPVIPGSWLLQDLSGGISYNDTDPINLSSEDPTPDSGVLLQNSGGIPVPIDLTSGEYQVRLAAAGITEVVLIDFDQTSPTEPYTHPGTGLVFNGFDPTGVGSSEGHFNMEWGSASGTVDLNVRNAGLDDVLTNAITITI